jgi:hypothetical protein
MKDKVVRVMGVESVFFLCSGEPSFITGHGLVVDAGNLVCSNVVEV